jgi:hypothetical protein
MHLAAQVPWDARASDMHGQRAIACLLETSRLIVVRRRNRNRVACTLQGHGCVHDEALGTTDAKIWVEESHAQGRAGRATSNECTTHANEHDERHDDKHRHADGKCADDGDRV